ncbi:MAG: hypothetical protein K2X37_13400 [Chitinophagaceae bacterium]|nr:hypothetical protein [Chitinophagaceae bacterium]
MKKFGGTIRQTGNEKEGYTPLDHFELPTARYHYGTLCALLNHPEKYPPNENPTYYQTVSLKRDDVLTDLYEWDKFQKAIEILRLNRHIKEEFNKGEWIYMEERIVCLTPKGLLALNTDFYLKQKIEDKYKENLPKYTKATIFFTALAAIAAITAAFYAKKQANKEAPIIINPPHQQPQEIHIMPIDTLKVKTVIVESQKH